MAELDFNIGAQVRCEDGICGKLVKVVVDPHTHRVTDLIVERGFIQKTDRVLPVSAVERTTDQDVSLSIGSDELGEYPKYREHTVKFRKPAPDWKHRRYKPEQALHWKSRYGLLYHRPIVPMVRYQVHKGISPEQEIIEKGMPVHNPEGQVGKVDHVLVDRETGEISHLVVRKGIVPRYQMIPASVIERVGKEHISVGVIDDELQDLPHFTPRADVDILAELADRLEASSFDLGDIKTTVEQGVVQLSGVVSDVASKRRAEAAARSVEGVIDVENALDTDTAVAARVTGALLSDPRTNLAVIEVVSERGLVTLKGDVDRPEVRQAAEEIAAEQTGVISVVNALEVKPDEDTEALKLWPVGKAHLLKM